MSKARDLSNFISDATVDATEIADLAVTHAKLHTDMNLSSKTLTFAANQISGNSVDGGVISNFASTGIDDNASSTAVTILSDGKVGIGTANPTYKLSISQEDNVGPSIELHQASNKKVWINNAGSAGHGSGRANRFEVNGTQAGHIWLGANRVTLGSSVGDGSETLTVLGSNVGIGTTNPPSPLTVQADGIGIRLDGTANSTRRIFFRSTSNANPAEIYADGTLRLWTEDPGTHIKLAPAGNVGIGDSNPTSLLSISKNSTRTTDFENMLKITHTSSGTTGVGFGSAIYFVGERENGVNQAMGRLLFDAEVNSGTNISSGFSVQTATAGSTSEKFRITHDGNVGIGTTSPGRELHVYNATEANIKIQAGSDYAELRVKDSDDRFSMHYNGSQVIALDSNEIFIHKNTSGIGTQGAYFNSNYSHITSTNDSPLALNRLGNNNNLNYALDVRKDSTNAGGISVQDTWNSTKTSSFHPMSSHTYGYGLHGLNLHGYDVGRLDQSNTFDGNSQSGAYMPGITGTSPKNMKYLVLHFQVVGNNVYYPFMINMNDVKGVLEIVGGDASSRGYKRWYVNYTSTAYGVYGITQAESVGGGWNSGSFDARVEAPNGALAVGFKFSSYYSSTNVASFKAIWRAM